MPWFYILVSINKHCDTWLVSECLPVEKLWLMISSLKKGNIKWIAFGCNHPDIIFTLLVWICIWILSKVTDKMRHYKCVVVGGKWWNSCWRNGRGLPCGPMYALSVGMCFWLGNALSFPQATYACFWIKWHCLLAACFSNQIGKNNLYKRVEWCCIVQAWNVIY